MKQEVMDDTSRDAIISSLTASLGSEALLCRYVRHFKDFSACGTHADAKLHGFALIRVLQEARHVSAARRAHNALIKAIAKESAMSTVANGNSFARSLDTSTTTDVSAASQIQVEGHEGAVLVKGLHQALRQVLAVAMDRKRQDFTWNATCAGSDGIEVVHPPSQWVLEKDDLLRRDT